MRQPAVFYEGFYLPVLIPLPLPSIKPPNAYLQTVAVTGMEMVAVAVHMPIVKEGYVTYESIGVIEAGDTHIGHMPTRLFHSKIHPAKIKYQANICICPAMKGCEDGSLAKHPQ